MSRLLAFGKLHPKQRVVVLRSQTVRLRTLIDALWVKKVAIVKAAPIMNVRE